MKLLVAKNGPLAGNAYAIAGRTLIGRDGDCDIQIIDAGVSRKHACVLEQDDGSVLLRDLMSHNGTALGSKPVREALLRNGDEICIGETRFEYRDADDDNATTLEVELKLMSGPAQDATTTVHISEIERDEMVASARRSSAAPRSSPPKRGSTPPCCGSALGEQARKQGWKFCPACGRAVSA
jgi:pSer/pThr/pTyr-binding forkhead associated (FHA) protein